MKRNNIEICRRLRKDQTDAERKLWAVLRDRRLASAKFRRQFSIGKYILDFYLPEYKLGIEVDGGGHYEDEAVEQDEFRTRELSRYGVKIIRFSNIDVMNNIEGVCEVILGYIENRNTPSPHPSPPHPNPLPGGERGNTPSPPPSPRRGEGVLNKILILLVLLASTTLYAQDDRNLVFKCGAHDERQFLSASVLKESGGIYKNSADIRRRMVSAAPAFLVSEEALVQFEKGKINRIDKVRRSFTLDSECSLGDVLNFGDIALFGIPALYPSGPVQIGSTWRKRITLAYQSGEVPVTVSYTLEKVDRMLDREVAVVSVLLSGVGHEIHDGSRKRWAGVGREIWDVKDGAPLLKVMEIKRGTSFVKDVDLELSYSESILF